jgi:predicted RNase H-like HicB family nuclease
MDYAVYTMKVAKKVGSRTFTILVQEEPEGGFTGRCLELRGAISYGKTISELKTNMKDAIVLILDELEEHARKSKLKREIIEIRVGQKPSKSQLA